MVGALGVNQAMLFTIVFACGAFLAGLGGALQLAREPANLAMDLTVLGDAFVVVVVGGMGSITGAYLAAVIIAEVKALCIGIGVVNFGGFPVNFSKLTLVAEFLVMAVVLIVRPYGLLGRPQAAVRNPAEIEDPLRPTPRALKILGARRARRPALLPAARARLALCARARHRRAARCDLRHQPALHHGARRHAFLRPCRLFRPRRLWRRAAGEILCAADAGRAGGGAVRRRHGRPPVRLVRGAALRRLSRDAHARVRPDRLGDRVPVGERDRRLERRRRRVAVRAVQLAQRLLPAHAGLRGRRRPAAAADAVRALRLRDARRPRLRACARRRSAST